MFKLSLGWLRMLSLAALVPLTGWLAWPALRTTTVERVAHQHQAQIAALSDRDAVQVIRRLAQEDALWLDVLVAASRDERPGVAAAAQLELREIVDRWAALPATENSTRASQLAAVLAGHAAEVPPRQRHFMHSLAHRLIDWPIDGQQIDAAKFIANCETVLLLPVLEDPEIRLAATIVNSLPTAPAEPPTPAVAPVVQMAPPPPPPQIPAPIVAQEPMTLPQANHETPVEPKQFLPPKAMRISDD